MDMVYLEIKFSDEKAMSSFKRRFREAHDKIKAAVTSKQERPPVARDTAHPTAEKPQQSGDSDKSVIVEESLPENGHVHGKSPSENGHVHRESPPENDHVYRAQGIPIEFEAEDKFGEAVTSKQERPPVARETAHPTAEKPQQSGDSDKSVIVEESPLENGHVYRVQGIPIEFEAGDVKRLLRLVLNLEESWSIEIRSLAIHHKQADRVAVVSFNPAPSSLSASSPAEREGSWKFKFGYGEGAKHGIRNISFDIHFRGPTVLSSCPNDKDHRIDICAVSGLGGHAYGSFKERSGPYMWLVDSLPWELKSARIMTFGFDTKLPDSQSTQDIKDLASFLFKHLEPITEREMSLETSGTVPSLPDTQKGRVRLPLIFIAHSLGGLVVKEAMLYAKDKGHTRFLESIHGGLFFGVPSRGMDISALIPMVEGQPNEALLKSIGTPSPTLKEQSKRFGDEFRDQGPRIIYFYETQLSPIYKFNKEKEKWAMGGATQLLVDRDSATDGRHWYGREDIYPLNKNHSNLVKFTEHDEHYPIVLKVLKDMVSSALLNSTQEESKPSSAIKSPTD
ncbi:hypothetical protein GP486_007020 [Trichoglossum hirsutum]|uniref:DUF676 domain-containing protein n=1 Tax=Trichoglossum hirsutum TaxID=265104 RepID=A0A9P8I746_9PEZI|nr:hypothetical protein GP486_007020 [Trichoglossum hirsutum]